MRSTWVTVAHNSSAKIFSVESPSAPLQEVYEVLEPEARMHERDLTSDLPGKGFDGKGQGSHALTAASSHKEQAALHCVKLVSNRLEAGRAAGLFDKLIVVAAPAFLGELRKNLSDATKSHIVTESDKNMAYHDVATVREYLHQLCPLQIAG